MKKKKIRTSDVCLVIVCVLEILFVLKCFDMMEKDIVVSSTLITYWHITFVAELFSLCGIKVAKVMKSTAYEKEDEYTDDGVVG